ncbi:hypothetical protein I5U67_07955 [Stenotrophomonas maltophilia]|uniref:Uncharacterized protein n=1 Tax=Stenotrophomonas maltophilia TaxID=40324 RepID=A0A6B8J258_STEMA|nr:hypothetical protein [Stenotrophomonas maltophilia]MBH1652099.1 hypothetical protein [Stenotrophomonas maltophilia]QGM00271.1 hypothetical protein FEO89_05775 [Stenotrophomonas maltophilia]HDS1508866.1 hypothetical protein [Stenotrophomonas maltophilia]
MLRTLRAPYSYAFLVASNLEIWAEFDAGWRRFGGSVLVAMFMVLQMIFVIMLLRYLGTGFLEGRSNPPFWVMLILAFALAWLISGSSAKHGESLAVGHDGKWATILAIYLIPGAGLALTLLWKQYIPFAVVHAVIIGFLCFSYGKYVVRRRG